MEGDVARELGNLGEKDTWGFFFSWRVLELGCGINICVLVLMT